MSGFIHLRAHSAYSLSEGAIKIKDLVGHCVKNNMPALGLCDTANLFGALEFSLAAGDAGVQPILGALIHLRRTEPARPGMAPKPDQLPLLVQNKTGYRNLVKLVSKHYLTTDGTEAPQINLTDLEGLTDGLIALTGGPMGRVGRQLAEGQNTAAEETLTALQTLFPDRLYVELMRHGLPVEDKIEPALIDLAYARDLPLVATNDVLFADEGMFEAHDVLLCIAEGMTVGVEDRRRVTRNHRFKTAAEMQALFADLPEAIDNTVTIARRCSFLLTIVKPSLPAFPAPEGETEADALKSQSEQGLALRLSQIKIGDDPDKTKVYHDRLAFELNVITEMGFSGYFLIVSDFIRWAKENGVPVGPGRGSGAGSLVAWSLQITDLDPIHFGLLFERFLNPERVSMPDFDIDFCQENRDKVIDYVCRKYGRDRVAQIITFGKLQARAALRDVGRVLEMPYSQVNRICKLVPNNPANPVTLAQAIKAEPQLEEMRDEDPAVARLLTIALKLEGLYRNASTHAAGVVIGDQPLDEIVPLYRDPRSSMPATQFNMKYVELAGLVKFDFLGLKTLDVIDAARKLLEQRGIEFDPVLLPLDDKKTYEMMSKADVTGVFQFESSGMRDLLRKAKPQLFEDLIALVALYRPGPMENIPKYVACKHGLDKPEFMHETIDPVVKETYGVIIYQEQVLQIAQVFAGYSLGGADLLRRAMGKKIKAEMDAQRDIFVKGAVAKNGVTAEHASAVFDLVDKFAGYGFNKAHSAAYAMVAYQTAYLKANYPVEFLAASMTLDQHDTDKLNIFRQELARQSIPLAPPDVQKSGPTFTVETDAEGKQTVRYALAALKGVGGAAMQSLADNRAEGGPFKSLGDFARRIDAKSINKRVLESLAQAGAFDSLHPNRAAVHGLVEQMVQLASGAAAERDSNQVNLFGGESMPDLTPKDIRDWPLHDRLQKEFDSVGFYLTAHPLDDYKLAMDRLGVVRQNQLAAKLAGGPTRVKMAGTITARQERTSKKGNRFCFLGLTDATGAFEVMVFSELLPLVRELADAGKPVLVTADARMEGEGLRMTAAAIAPLDEAAQGAAAGLRIYLRDPSPIGSLRQIFHDEGPQLKGKGLVSLLVDVDDKEVEIHLPNRYAVSPSLRQRVKTVPGVVDVQEV